MSLRAIPASMEPTVIGSIDRELDRIERQHEVSIRLAIESGSRAWGFPSPDSDYDCRFVYVSGLHTYLSPWPSRDVIETPLTPVLDVNGWDLAKALRLLVRGNAVLIEWLMSPIVYRGDSVFRERMRTLADDVADRNKVARHYLYLGAEQWKLYDRHRSLKKVFYSLRPAMALRWLRENPTAKVAPMHLPTLMAHCDLPADLLAEVAALTALKSRTREMGHGVVPEPIARFVTNEFGLAEAAFPKSSAGDSARARALTAEFFRTEALAGRPTVCSPQTTASDRTAAPPP